MVYISMNESGEETKDQLYSRLQSILHKSREKDVTILVGAFSAKIGMDNNGSEDGVGQMNENGEMLADACLLNNFVIGGNISTHNFC